MLTFSTGTAKVKKSETLRSNTAYHYRKLTHIVCCW